MLPHGSPGGSIPLGTSGYRWRSSLGFKLLVSIIIGEIEKNSTVWNRSAGEPVAQWWALRFKKLKSSKAALLRNKSPWGELRGTSSWETLRIIPNARIVSASPLKYHRHSLMLEIFFIICSQGILYLIFFTVKILPICLMIEPID